MRIIAGEYKGRVLQAPKGDATRPTTDRVREALMSTLISAGGSFEGARVLDAFAGSGALGLEALSRGAENAVFYEKHPAALRVLRGNITSLGILEHRYSVHPIDILKNPPQAGASAFDLLFLDPPYALKASAIKTFLEAMNAAGMLPPEALISYEHGKSFDSAVEQAFDSLQWEFVSRKHYGDIALTVLRRRP